MKLSLKYDDVMEIQAGELEPYGQRSMTGKTLGWFDPADLDGIDDDFPGVVYADVHHIPILLEKDIAAGTWHDSYYARVVGYARQKPDWMGKDDILLTTIYEEVAARTEFKDTWKGHLKTTFKNTRLMYQRNDRPQHECGKELLTNRELDVLTHDMKCSDCNIDATMVNRGDISLNMPGTKFTCADCVIAGLEKDDKTKKAAVSA